jgi:hypothetical protein
MASPSKIMKRGAESNGKASRSYCATQSAVGVVVTPQRTTSRRPWRMTRSTWRMRNVAVGTEKKSMAAMPFRWFRRNVVVVRRKVVQVCPARGCEAGSAGGGRRCAPCLEAQAQAQQFPVDAGCAPGFSEAILRMRARTSRGRAAGALAAPGQPVPVAPEAGAVPAHDRIRLDDGEAPGPTTPESAQQDPEEPVGWPKDRASSTGQGGKLLAEDQVLDHEVASRAQGRVKRRQEGYEAARHQAGEDPGPGLNRQWFQARTGFWRRTPWGRWRCWPGRSGASAEPARAV